MAKPQGKYEAVLQQRKLLPFPVDDPSRQAQIDELKRQLDPRDAVALAQSYVALRARYDALKAQLSTLYLQVEAHEQRLAESQEARANGWGQYGAKDNMLRLPSGETVRIQPEPSGKVVDREAFRAWCIANGYERQLHLHSSTMQAIVKERLLHGEPEPDGTEVYAYTKVVLTRKGHE
jgi:hypothetical protein